MTQDNYTDTDDVVDESVESDSPIMKALRKQVNDLTKQVKGAPDRATIEAEIRAGLAREKAISEQLIALGHPAGMSDTVAAKLGDAEATPESVAAALTAIGYQVAQENDGASDSGEQSQGQSDLAKVTSLSSQVSAAATRQPSDDGLEKISAAKSPAELAAVMAQIEGATRDYTGV